MSAIDRAAEVIRGGIHDHGDVVPSMFDARVGAEALHDAGLLRTEADYIALALADRVRVEVGKLRELQEHGVLGRPFGEAMLERLERLLNGGEG